MFHTLPGLVDAIRADHQPTATRVSVPGDDFDGVIPHTALRRSRRSRRAGAPRPGFEG